MKSFSGLYDFWQRGKRLRFDFWLHFSPKSDFHKIVIYVITKLLRARQIIVVIGLKTGPVRSGPVRSGPVRSGPVWSGLVIIEGFRAI